MSDMPEEHPPDMPDVPSAPLPVVYEILHETVGQWSRGERIPAARMGNAEIDRLIAMGAIRVVTEE